MGNDNSKANSDKTKNILNFFNSSEQKILRNTFDILFELGSFPSSPTFATKNQAFQKLFPYSSKNIQEILDNGLVTLLRKSEALYTGNLEQKHEPRESAYFAFLEVAYSCLRGSIEQKFSAFSLLFPFNSKETFINQLRNLVSIELGSYATHSRKYQKDAQSFEPSQRLLSLLISGSTVSLEELETKDFDLKDGSKLLVWFRKNSHIQKIVDNFFHRLFLMQVSSMEASHSSFCEDDKISAVETRREKLKNQERLLFPPLLSGEKSNLLTIDDLWVLHCHLPKHCKHKWSKIYSSTSDGHAWHPFANAIKLNGSTLILIKAKNGTVFGCFALEDWEPKPEFYGSPENFLFTLQPNLGIYPKSGYNDNFQYMEEGMQTLPNGLGLGGQLEYFGLFIASDFIHGHSRANPTSTTFLNPPLASEQEFEIEQVEVYQVLESKRDPNSRSGKNMTAAQRAHVMDFLDMAGVSTYAKTAGIKRADEEENI